MSGAEVGAEAFPVGFEVETVDDVRSGCLDGPLYRVVGLQGVLDVRRVERATGALDGEVTVCGFVSDLDGAHDPPRFEGAPT